MLLMLGQQGLGEPHSQVNLLLALSHAKHTLGQGWGVLSCTAQPPAALPLLCGGMAGAGTPENTLSRGTLANVKGTGEE